MNAAVNEDSSVQEDVGAGEVCGANGGDVRCR